MARGRGVRGALRAVDLLGEGGMGAVWRAFDHRTGSYVAAKVLRQSDAVSLLRFVREQTFRISHPHVVAPLGWAGEDDRVLFTMDLVRGGSLATLVGDYGPLPAEWVAVLVSQVLLGLSAVHAAGLVHRDIKPGNVLLEPTGRSVPGAKLTDFGLAVAASEPRLTSTSQLLGTPGYLAPELVRGSDPAPRQDLYAVGLLMAELLSGARPAPNSPLPSAGPDGVSEQLWTFARRLAAWSPEDRPETAEQAQTELAALGVLPPPGVPPDDEGADLEVLDVVPDLPNGWGPRGPGGGSERPPAAPPGNERAVGAEGAAARESGGRGGEGLPVDPSGIERAADAGAAARELAAPVFSEPSGEPASARESPAPGVTRARWRWPLAIVSFLLIAVGLSVGAWVLTNDALWSRPGEGSSPSPTSTSRPPAASGECDFTEAGQRETTSTGDVLVCRQRPDGSYRWVP